MGKRLIIKGADFSANALGVLDVYEDAWYSENIPNSYSRPQSGASPRVTFNQASKYWALNDNIHKSMRNKVINAVRLIPIGYSSLNLYVVSSITSALPSTPDATASFEAGSSEITVKLDKEITLGSNEYLVFDNGAYQNTGEDSNYEDQNFYRKVCSSEANLYNAGNALILMDFGYKN